jgi:16S rRNA (uracil1498-N3)-methyltransferase
LRVPRIYTTQDLYDGGEFLLEEAPSLHILKVLRMEVGRELIVFNGSGGEYQAVIQGVSKRHATIATTSFSAQNNESSLKTHLAVGISRGDRFDFVLQKATELGVSEITPLFTKRTEVKLQGDRLTKRVSGWEKTIISACEQCNRNILPQFNQPMKYLDFVDECEDDLKFVLHHRAEKNLNSFSVPKSVTILIGPEGGLSEEEIQAALEVDFEALVLGPRVMRTETAPLVALSNMQFLWGDI